MLPPLLPGAVLTAQMHLKQPLVSVLRRLLKAVPLPILIPAAMPIRLPFRHPRLLAVRLFQLLLLLRRALVGMKIKKRVVPLLQKFYVKRAHLPRLLSPPANPRAQRRPQVLVPLHPPVPLRPTVVPKHSDLLFRAVPPPLVRLLVGTPRQKPLPLRPREVHQKQPTQDMGHL